MVAQLLLNGFVTGLIFALPALALSLIFGVLKFPNFAIGAMLTSGAYLTWILNARVGLPLWQAAVLGCLGFACVSALVDRIVFSPLRERGSVTLLVASIGVSFVLENVFRFAYGNDARNFDVPVARPIRWEGLRINNEQITTFVAVAVCLVLMHVLLRHTGLGRAMRAVADNPSLAAVRGVDREAIARITWGVAGVLTGIAGVLVGLDRAIDPLMGWNYIIPVFAAAILGGLGSPVGAVVGALLIGMGEELSTLFVPTNYRQAVAFLLLVLLLLLRPRGLFGTVEIRK